MCPYCGSYWCGVSPSGASPRCYERYEMSMRPKTEFPRPRLPSPFDLSDVEEPNRPIEDLTDLLEETKEQDLLAYLTAYLGDPVFARRFADCIDLIKAKNSDYTGGQAKRDRIAHFREAARDLDLPILKIWQVFTRKHWSAIQKFVNGGTLESEPVDGRINDIINYMVLLGAIIDDKKDA